MGNRPGNGIRVDATSTGTGTAIQPPGVIVVDVRCSAGQDHLPETLSAAVVQAEAGGYRHYNTVVAGEDRYLLFCRRL